MLPRTIGIVVLPAVVALGSVMSILKVSGPDGSMSCTVTLKLNGPVDGPPLILSEPVPVKVA